MSLFDLNRNELIAIAKWPSLIDVVPGATEKAFKETNSRFSSGHHNGEADAFRHCYWSALICRDTKYEAALEFTTAHEDYPSNPPKEKAMDLHNNARGLKIGLQNSKSDDSKLSMACFAAFKTGLLKTSP